MASSGGFDNHAISEGKCNIMLLLFRRKGWRLVEISGFWDSVWSRVTGSVIFAIICAIWAGLKFKWWNRLTARWAIKLTMTNCSIGYQAGVGYPLKCHIEMRNDSSRAVEVRVSDYIPEKIRLKSFPPEVMQIRFNNKWFPPDSQDRVAVLPGQLCRAWIGLDDATFSEIQAKAATGNIGKLVVSANKKHFSFQL